MIDCLESNLSHADRFIINRRHCLHIFKGKCQKGEKMMDNDDFTKSGLMS